MTEAVSSCGRKGVLPEKRELASASRDLVANSTAKERSRPTGQKIRASSLEALTENL